MRVHRLLTAKEKAQLRQAIEEVERHTSAEVCVIIVPSAGDPEAFARAYFDAVGIGKEGLDNGLLILVAVRERTVRIEVGRGLGAVITPQVAQRILDEVILPWFREGRYGEGLRSGVEAFGAILREHFPERPGVPGRPIPDIVDTTEPSRMKDLFGS
ncbi:MAG: TPM domain-containing protein [Armatimonadota bacterium]|nr:TPM domain-containing protein [Armatimonadota bacterium]